MPHTARPGAAAWHCHVQCDARQLDVDFKLSRPIPVRGSTVLADAWHNIGGQAAPPLGCNLGDSSDDAISIGSFT